MSSFRKIKAGLVNSEITEFVGEIGNLFFNIETGELRLSDGMTPHGKPISGSVDGILYLDGGDAFSDYTGTFVLDGGGP